MSRLLVVRSYLWKRDRCSFVKILKRAVFNWYWHRIFCPPYCLSLVVSPTVSNRECILITILTREEGTLWRLWTYLGCLGCKRRRLQWVDWGWKWGPPWDRLCWSYINVCEEFERDFRRDGGPPCEREGGEGRGVWFCFDLFCFWGRLISSCLDSGLASQSFTLSLRLAICAMAVTTI